MEELAQRYEAVLERIHSAAQRAGRNPAEITLVAVSKTWPAERLLEAYRVGMRHFGENRVEELAEKRPYLTHHLGLTSGITWHAIGTLQSRKTDLAADYADVFHAIDRLKIANRLSARLIANGRLAVSGRLADSHPFPIFLEVNVSGEVSKAGINCQNWETDATQQAELRTVAQQITQLPALYLTGLMTMAPWDVEPSLIQTVFRRTRQLAAWLQTELELTQPLQLSMGMTDDFEIAIAEGATHVRVGRAIFGEREP